MTMPTDEVYSWDQFKKTIGDLRRYSPGGAKYVFRGHGSDEWKLETTLERSSHPRLVSSYYRMMLRVKPEIESLTGLTWPDGPSWPTIDAMLQDYEPFALNLRTPPHYEYMTYLRHHGFPTPLLDWSRSPFVAAYFAFARPSADHAVIYAYCESPLGPKFSSNTDPQIASCGPFISTHKRHFAQQSQYTICVQHDQNGHWRFMPHSSVFDAEVEGQDRLYRFRISSNERAKILRELSDYNLNAFSLFGSQDSLMETISVREELAGPVYQIAEALIESKQKKSMD